MIRTFSPWKPSEIACTECKIECLIVIDIFARSKGNHMIVLCIKINTNLFPLTMEKGCAHFCVIFFTVPVFRHRFWRQSGRFPHSSLVCFRTNEPINLIVILLHRNALVDLKKNAKEKSGEIGKRYNWLFSICLFQFEYALQSYRCGHCDCEAIVENGWEM